MSMSARCLQVAVARLVADVFGRLAARTLAEATTADLRQQVALLQQRVERLGRMTGAMRARVDADGGEEDTLQKRLTNVGVMVACAGAGVAGAFLIIRQLKAIG